jgi:hypothetical protein
MQPKTGQLLAGTEAEGMGACRTKARFPLSRPANGQGHPARLTLHVEER